MVCEAYSLILCSGQVAMGLSALFPVLHGIKMFGIAQLDQQMGLSWLVTQGLLYILGAGIYAVSRQCRHERSPGRAKMFGGYTRA